MLRNLFLKSLRDQRWAVFFWGLGVAVVAAFYISFYPTMRSMGGLQELMDSLPKALRDILSNAGFVDISTPSGFLALEIFSFIIPGMLVAMAVTQASGAVAGEEERGTLDFLLSLPITRLRVIVEKFATLLASTAAVAALAWIGVSVSAPFADMDISPWAVGQLSVSLWLLSLVFGSLALAVGSVLGGRGRSAGIAGAAAVAAYIVNILAPSVEALNLVRPFSPFYYFTPASTLDNGLDWAHAGVLGMVTLVFLLVAIAGFRARDIRT